MSIAGANAGHMALFTPFVLALTRERVEQACDDEQNAGTVRQCGPRALSEQRRVGLKMLARAGNAAGQTLPGTFMKSGVSPPKPIVSP